MAPMVPPLRDGQSNWTPVCLHAMTLLLDAQDTRGWKASSSVACTSCGHGPRQSPNGWVIWGNNPFISNQFGDWQRACRRSPVVRARFWVPVPGLGGPGQPGEQARQRRPTHASPWSMDNRCEWLSLPSLAKQPIPWTDKWQPRPTVPSLEPVKGPISGIEWDCISAQVYGFLKGAFQHSISTLFLPPPPFSYQTCKYRSNIS